jgi:predicted RNA-binding protein
MFLYSRNGEYFLHPEADPKKLHLPAKLIAKPNLLSKARNLLEVVAASDKLSGSTKNMEALNDVISACMNCQAK